MVNLTFKNPASRKKKRVQTNSLLEFDIKIEVAGVDSDDQMIVNNVEPNQ